MSSNNNISEVQDEELGNIGVRGNGLPLTHQSDATGINAAATVGPSTPATSNTREDDLPLALLTAPMGDDSVTREVMSATATLAAGTNQDARMLEQFDDDVGPYRPTLGDSDDEDQILKGKGHVEEIKDNVNPDHELSHLTDGNTNETKKMATAPAKLEIIDDDGFPVNPTEFEDDIDVKMRAKASNDKTAVRSDEESILVPTNEEIEGEAEAITRGVNVIRNRGNRQPHRPLVNVGGMENNANAGHSINRESSVPVIPEAFLVQESDVVVATPTVPWWKQRRTRFLLCLVFVVVTVLSVALGVAFSSRGQTITELVAFTSSPSISTRPTMHPTTGRPSLIPSSKPSTSQVPSASPSACSDTIISNMQKLSLLRPDLDSPKVAIDGDNMVVVSRSITETFGHGYDKGSLYIEFYSREDEWELVGYLIEADFEWERFIYSYDVSLSGETAAVGLPAKEVVYVYQRDIYGLWAKIDSLEPQFTWGPCGFGQSVDIDGDLLVVVDHYECASLGGINVAPNAVHIFKRNANKWEEIDVLSNDGEATFVDSSVKGGIVAVADRETTRAIDLYQHDNLHNITLMQRIETTPNDGWIKSIDALGDHHLIISFFQSDGSVCSRCEADKIIIFYRADPNKEFSYLQHFNTSDYEDGFGSAITMQKGILAVGGGNATHFFVEQDNGMFAEENLVLDQQYDNFQLSGRTLVAANGTKVHALDLEGCTQAAPTQRPTLTMAPTSCFMVNLTFNTFLEWEAVLEKIESTGAVIVKSYSHEYDLIVGSNSLPDQYEDSLCIDEGRYQFSISGVGHQEQPEKLLSAHYSVQSEGRVIAQGGGKSYVGLTIFSQLEVRHSTEFDLPFDPLAATSPTGSPYGWWWPKTLIPTVSPAPTTPYPTTQLPTWLLSTPAPQTPSAKPTIIISSQSPSNSESKASAKVCLNQSECANQLEKTGLESFNLGDYPDYGCFMKGDKLYWGLGGTNEQMAIDPLSGAKERVWC